MGEGWFYKTDGRGGLERLSYYQNWRNSWYIIIPGNFSSSSLYTDLLFYDRNAGEGWFYSTDGRGRMNLLKGYTNWRTSWDMIIPGHFGGVETSGLTDLLFYDRSAGEGTFYTVYNDGRLNFLRHHSGWRTSWDMIIPGHFGNESPNVWTDLLFYDRSAGIGRFYTTDGRGRLTRLRSYNNWRTSWTRIIPANFGGTGFTDLLFYDSRRKEGWFYTTDGLGGLTRLRSYNNWRTSWFRIIPGMFAESGSRDLLFYDNGSGEGWFYTTDGHGGLNRLSFYRNWRKTWHNIIPGNFGGSGYTDLLFYDTNINTGPV